MGEFIDHKACPDCGGSDCVALHQEEDGTFNGTCWSECRTDSKKGFKSHNHLARSYLGQVLGIEPIEKGKVVEKRKKKLNIKKKELKPISTEQLEELKENTTSKGGGFRGIKDKWLNYYKILTEYDEETRKVSARYYPVTKGKDKNGAPKLMGYHKRIVLPEKDFRAYPAGSIGKECELFGQWKCKGRTKLVLTGGEEDVAAAKQMHEAYRERQQKKDKNVIEIDFVSCVTGEGVMAEQLRLNYDFIDRYDEIIIDMDDDDAGEQATEAILEVLPLNKTKLMTYSVKDANSALEEELEDEYVRAIYNARKPRISGISDINEIVDSITDVVEQEKIPLPSFLDSVNKALAGGYFSSSFNVIAAQTSIGKTSQANEILYHFMENNIKTGLLSLEASKGFVGEQLFSLFLHKRLSDIEDIDEKVDLIEKHKEDFIEFMSDENGDSNLFILDDRSLLDDIDSIFKNINKLIRSCNCQVIIIDVLSDLTDTLSNEEQSYFMGKIKKLIATQPICVIGIMHMRKPSDRRDPHDVSEFDIYGSSSAIKSAHTVLLLSRDKLSDDEDERNTTRVRLTKNRNTGRTGRMNDVFYDFKTGRLNEKKWSENNF